MLSLLRNGRITPAYASEETGYSRGNITNRLTRLVEHGYVSRLHDGLYELDTDPEAVTQD